jgi:hypothetical protein
MSAEDYKHQVVEDDEDGPEVSSADGTWETLVHDCRVPKLSEIVEKKAAVNSVWSCNNCGDRWKLINHTKHGTLAALEGKATLVWRRITPKDED